METLTCRQCGKEYEAGAETCPHCGSEPSGPIPDYPRFGGGVFMVMWIFFIALVILLLVSMFSV